MLEIQELNDATSNFQSNTLIINFVPVVDVNCGITCMSSEARSTDNERTTIKNLALHYVLLQGFGHF